MKPLGVHEIPTRLGRVEVALSGTGADVILMFPGGHSSARTPACERMYVDLGYRVATFSRPGYGCTDAGALTALEFVPAVVEVCAHLGIEKITAVVGVSFGGLQAAQVAASLGSGRTPRLLLHSSVSSLPYPDSRIERIIGPVAFSPMLQGLTWRAVRSLVSSDRGLRIMMSSLSTLPVDDWWETWSDEDREAARAMFREMASGKGFTIDLRQAAADRAGLRSQMLRSIDCPTLITASRHDGAVAFAHADDLGHTISESSLVETTASSHLSWLGPSRHELSDAVEGFLVN